MSDDLSELDAQISDLFTSVMTEACKLGLFPVDNDLSVTDDDNNTAARRRVESMGVGDLLVEMDHSVKERLREKSVHAIELSTQAGESIIGMPLF